jgi:hypothetical protein
LFSAGTVASHKQFQLLEIVCTFQPSPGACAQRAVQQALAFHVMLNQPSGPRRDVVGKGFQTRRHVVASIDGYSDDAASAADFDRQCIVKPSPE